VKIAGSGARSESGSISQSHGFADGSGSTPKCHGSATLVCAEECEEDLQSEEEDDLKSFPRSKSDWEAFRLECFSSMEMERIPWT
jgi:hypothetical protein